MPPRSKSRRGRRAKTPSKKASETGRGKSRKGETIPTPAPDSSPPQDHDETVSSTGAENNSSSGQHRASDEGKYYNGFLNSFLECIQSRLLSLCVCFILIETSTYSII